MKKQTMYNRLQKHYNKLNQRIQKAMQTGRFYTYTQFKQQQLLNRLNRFSLQLKQLGAGVAVVAALGMATPVVGQSYNLVQRTGAANPFEGIGLDINTRYTTFVDIDGDGDQDFFGVGYNGTVEMQYFENTGSATNPNFVLQTGANDPLDSFSGIYDMVFVDIDGDGDQDMFSTGYAYFPQTVFDYYENTGSATNPNFVLQTTANPLDSVVMHLNALNFPHDMSAHPSFVDIDGDGDQDCFIGVGGDYQTWPTTASAADKLWYYENVGTNTAPDFQRTSNANNPLGHIMTDPSVAAFKRIGEGIQFFDADTDGDSDAVIQIEGTCYYLKNDGTATTPMLDFATGITPLDSLNTTSSTKHINYVDIDGDLDFDALTREGNFPIRYYENTTPVGITQLDRPIETIAVYPNPTDGNISLDKAVTGQLHVFNVTGQKVYTRQLEDVQSINLSSLTEGTYLLSIEQENKRLQQTIIIQK